MPPIVATTLMISAGATTAALAGVIALLVWGIRGRRIDDHPLCRRCGFDLYGKPAGSSLCSECGANLHDDGAIRMGNRARRPTAIFLALPLLLALFTLLGTFGWVGVRGVDANRYMPTWWLVSELGSKAGRTRDGALAELDTRLLAGKLSAGQIGRIAGRALAIQADADQPWSPNWGDFVEHAYDKGVLPGELWQRYVRQAVADGLTVHTRPILRRGDDLPTSFQIIVGRCGKTYGYTIGGTIIVAIGGATSKPLPLPDQSGAFWQMGASGVYQVPFDAATLKGVAEGSQSVRVSVAIEVTPFLLSPPAATAPPGPSNGASATPPPVAPIDLPLSADAPPITLLAADHPSVIIVADAARRAPVAEAVRADVYPGSSGMVLEVHVQQAPLCLEADVFLRDAKAEQKVGHLMYQANGSETESFFIGRPAMPCEVVLRPRFETALTTLDATGIFWGEQIVVKDVPLTTAPAEQK